MVSFAQPFASKSLSARNPDPKREVRSIELPPHPRAAERDPHLRRPNRPRGRSVEERARVLREYERVERAIAFSSEAGTQTAMGQPAVGVPAAPLRTGSHRVATPSTQPLTAHATARSRAAPSTARPRTAPTTARWRPASLSTPAANTALHPAPATARWRPLSHSTTAPTTAPPATQPSASRPPLTSRATSREVENEKRAREAKNKGEAGKPPVPVGCWNCRRPGHRYTECPSPREQKFCYRCGRDGWDVHSCPFCPEDSRTSASEGSTSRQREATSEGPCPAPAGPAGTAREAPSPLTASEPAQQPMVLQSPPVGGVLQSPPAVTSPTSATIGQYAGQPFLFVMPGATVYLGGPPPSIPQPPPR